MEPHKNKRRRKRKNKNKQSAYNNAFVFEYAFESITERGSRFKRNMPEDE